MRWIIIQASPSRGRFVGVGQLHVLKGRRRVERNNTPVDKIDRRPDHATGMLRRVTPIDQG
jgi:hypothetical protein